MTLAVSGSSAYTVDPAPMYMTSPTTSGVTCSAGVPVSNVHAFVNCTTLAAVICFSVEYRWPPGSPSREGQSFPAAYRSATNTNGATNRNAPTDLRIDGA